MTRRPPSPSASDAATSPAAPGPLDDTQTKRDGPFDIGPSLAMGEDSGSLRLGPFERHYESLYAEALQSGAISPPERARLDQAAAALGLDPARVAALEAAVLDAWESDAAQTLADPRSDTLGDRPGASMAPPPAPVAPAAAPDEDGPTVALRRALVRPASGLDATTELRARWSDAMAQGSVDRAWRIADVLARRAAATQEQREFWERHRKRGPIQPTHPLDAEAWAVSLGHAEEDRTASEMFGLIAPAALLGRVSAMRRDGTLPRLAPESYQDPAISTVSAARALNWAAATLGLRAPPAYVAPDADVGFEVVTVVPPSTRIGARALTGWNAAQLAFACGRHLSWFREEHFICTLVPNVAYLEAIFYATLLLGAPALRLPDDVAARARVFAQAIVPFLEPAQIQRLRLLVAGFLSKGAQTNLRRWLRAVEWTACRAGLLLCGELSVAAELLANEPGAERRIAELEAFWAGDAAGRLRVQLGVALT